MRTKHILLLVFAIGFVISGLSSCKKETPVEKATQSYGNLTFSFSHKVNGQPLVLDTFLYVNAANNYYQVQEVKYFVSDITLYKAGGGSYTITDKNGIHYVDTNYDSTWTWNVADDIPAGEYQSISFTFGINQVKNKKGLFDNPPQSNMSWPDHLGGGYHYLMLNGFWIDTTGNPSPFNFHLGIGQIYDSVNTDSVISFVQNYFISYLPNSSFTLDPKGSRDIGIVMNIDSWFDTPNIWDFNDPVNYGSAIMQNQKAMQAAKENGAGVFTIGYIQ